METHAAKMFKQDRYGLNKVLYRVWPNLKKIEDILYVYYAGPTGSPWDRFDESTDSVFIKNINEQVANGKTTVVLYNISEILREPTIDKIHRCLPELKVDQSRIYFATGSLDGPEIYHEYCKTKGYRDRINIIAGNIFLDVSKSQTKLDINIEYVPKIRSKKFLCFNRVHRVHRIVLVCKLMALNLLDTGYCSFYGNHFNSDWIDELNPIRIHSTELELLKENKHLFPMHLTGNAVNRNNPIDMIVEDQILFDNSYYSIVTETYFYEDPQRDGLSSEIIPSMFFTEKMYKPISMHHPFILVSRANSLKWLKKLGFKTFSPYINESYDDEMDDNARMNLIVAEVQRLNQFTDEEWLVWQQNVKSIVDHNFQLYITLDDFSFNPNKNLDF